jgi:hypothetical protein
MKNIILVVLSLLFLVCCNDKSQKSIQNSTQHSSSIVPKSKTNLDSLNRKSIEEQMALGDRPDSEQETPSIAKERERLINSYSKIAKIDTTIIFNGNNLQIQLIYYCLKDSALVIPKIFVFDEKNPKDFNTYDFASKILISTDKDTLFKRVIGKQEFYPIISKQLQKYGTLRIPTLSISSDKNLIRFHYSISIPVTDIGVGVYLLIDKSGEYRISKD